MAIQAQPSSPSVGSTVIATQPSSGAQPAPPVSGGLEALSSHAPGGSLEALPANKKLMLRSGGFTHEIKLSDAQKQEHARLHRILTEGHPNATVNVTRGYLEENGKPILYFKKGSDLAQALQEMRLLFHSVLGQEYSDILWPEFRECDRASTTDVEPFQKRRECDPLSRIQFAAGQVPKAQLREYHTSRKLQKGVVQFLEQQIRKVDTRFELGGKGRVTQLTTIKEQFEKCDEVVTGFYATNPPPDLSNKTDQEKLEALQTYKKTASLYLYEAEQKHQPLVKNPLRSREEIDKAIDEMATEMALMGCLTREDYDFGCLALDTKHCKSTPELFLAHLSALLAKDAPTYDIALFIENHFSLAFYDLSQEDHKAALDQLDDLIAEIQSELNSEGDEHLQATSDRFNGLSDADYVATYNRRIEQLDIVKKQEEITEQLKELTDELTAKRPDLTVNIQGLTRLKTDLDAFAVEFRKALSNDVAYRPFADQILGVGRLGDFVRGRDKADSLIHRFETQIAELENQATQTALPGMIQQLKILTRREEQLGKSITQKDKKLHEV